MLGDRDGSKIASAAVAGSAATRLARRGALARVMRNATVQRVISVAVVLALWQLIGSHYPYSISSPKAIYEAAKDTLRPDVLPAFGHTLQAFGLGFAICIVAGVPIGLAMARLRLARVVLEPYVNTFYSLPMVALFPLLIVAFGVAFPLRVGATVLFGLFAVVVNTYVGASNIDSAMEDAARVFVASPWKRLTTVILPASLPYIFAGIRISFGHGMIGAVVIEIEASAVGVGELLRADAQDIRIDRFFVVVFVLGFFSILCGILMRLTQRFLAEPWTRPRRLRTYSDAWGVHNGRLAELLTRVGGWVYVAASALRALAVRARSAALLTTRPVNAVLRTAWGRWVVRIVVLVALLAWWQNESRHINKSVLPSPSSVAQRFYHQVFISHSAWGPLGQSIELLFIGWVAAVVLGVVVGLAMGQFRAIGNILDPYVSFLYALPHAVFIPIMVVWLGFEFKFGLAYVVISAIFPVLINAMQSVRSIKAEYIDTARSFCASNWAITRTVIWPHAVPFIVTGARVAFSVSWIAVVVSEVLTSQQGLGGLITAYGNNYETADSLVPVVLITIISVTILQFSTWLQPRLTPWASSRLGR